MLLGLLATRSADVRWLAGALQVHPNAVRQHLQVLQHAGLVTAELDRGGGRVGRPRVLYRASPHDAAANPFEHLSRLLVRVAGGRTPIEVGRQDGRSAARSGEWTDAAEAVADVAARTGFSVRVARDVDGAVIELGDCPFAAMVGGVVCDLHRGIVEGAAGAAEGVVRSFEVHDPARQPCRVALQTRPEPRAGSERRRNR